MSVFTEKDAVDMLEGWLKERHAWITYYFSQSYWEYSSYPFWALTVNVISDPQYSTMWGHYGFHVYSNGEVKLINKG